MTDRPDDDDLGHLDAVGDVEDLDDGGDEEGDGAEVFERLRSGGNRWDDEAAEPAGLSTYTAADTVRGPQPPPDWVIVEGEATEDDLGILKTGKEADVHVVERRWGEAVNVLAVKRYRGLSHRGFRDDVVYRAGAQQLKDRRMQRALDKGTTKGMVKRAKQWAANEMRVLSLLWNEGVAVPYPVQLRGTEVALEYLGDDRAAAPRLQDADLDADAALVHDLAGQAVEVLRRLAELGIVHGDLSPYNLLVWQGRLVVIDVPQAVDLYKHRHGGALFRRDVETTLGFFARRGVDVDPLALIDELLPVGL